MSYGAQIKFGIARQASANSWVPAVTSPGSYHGFALTAEQTGLEKQELISQNLTGRFEQGAVYSGPANIAGTIDFELTPRNIGIALAAVVNHSPATVTSGSVKAYTFLPNTQDFSATLVKAPFSIYKQFTDAQSAFLFYDCQFGQLALTIGQGAFVKGNIAVAGGTYLTGGVGSASVVPDGSDVGVLFPWNVASISYGGSGVSNYSELTISLNESIDPLYAINGTLAPFKFTRSAFREVTVNGTMYFTDRTAADNFVSETQARLLVTLVNTRTAIQSGYFNTLTIDVPQLKITAFKPSVSGPGEVAVPITGRGVLDPTSNYAVQFVLTNTYGAGY